MNIVGFDLNLLIAFDALLSAGSVTRAARRLGISQPALSNALSRLRDQVGDRLFQRTSRGMTPTSRALEMAEPVRTALAEFQRAIAAPAKAAPVERTVIVAANSYAQCVLLPRVVHAIESSAPRVRLDVRSPEAASVGPDVAFSIEWAGLAARTGKAIDSTVVLRDPLAFIARRGNRAIGARLTLDGFTRSQHVAVSAGATLDMVDLALSGSKHHRRVQVTVPDFLPAIWLVSQSDLIAAVPRRFAELFASRLALRVFKPPLNLPDAVLEINGLRRGGQDPVVMSVRTRVLEVGRRLAGNPRA